MARIAIVATFYQRQKQLDKTLASIAKTKHKDFEVIIVDDCSPDEIILPEVNFPITIIQMKDKTWTNPEPAYNTGIIEALKGNPDIIILQNAECYHEGDVLSYAERVTDESYISFGCYSLSQETTFREHNINEIISSNNVKALVNGENAWYNHPVHRDVGYDFCSAVTASNMRKLNGYDERFSSGCSYGDDYLIERVKMLGLRVEITETPFVVHQWHYSNPGHPDHDILCKRNAELLKRLVPGNNYRAVHTLTPDL